MIASWILAAACLLLFFHPYIVYPLTLRMFPEFPLRRDPTRAPPSATAVFSAYNEEAVLPAKIENLRQIKLLHPQIELFAYADFSADNTLSILEAQTDLIHVIPARERSGKATGMRKMALAAKGEVVIFTDANVILEPESVARLLSYFTDPQIGGVAGSLRYINEGDSPTARIGGLYWRLEELLKRLEARCGSIMGADGSIFATRRALYPEVPPHLLDDMIVSMSVTFEGMRLIHANDVIAFEKSATSIADEFRRKRRIACRAFNTHCYLWPQIRKTYSAINLYKYVSHKVLRWFGAVPLALAVLFIATALLMGGHAFVLLELAVLAGGFFLLGFLGVSPFSLFSGMLLSIGATFYGVIDAFNGKTYQTWAPATSRN